MPSTWTTKTWSGSPTGGPTRWSASTRRPRSSRRFRASAAARTCARSSGAPARCGRRSPAPIGSSSIARSDAVKLLFFDDFRLGVLTGAAVVDVSQVEGEAEVALVIGRRASHVRAAEAMSYVFGYTNFIDGSARGLPPAGNTFYQMKSRDTFAPMGPYLVTADEVPDPHGLQIRLWVNGTLKQNFSTSDMAHRIPRCIEWVTSIHTLEPGDVLATGTNHRGLSAFQDGDMVELETEGLGRLCLHVRDDVKRTWAREPRLERQQKGLEGTTPQVAGKHTPPPR